MDIRPLKTEADYDAALQAISQYFEKEPEPGTPAGDRFELLTLVIGDYEDRHWHIDPPEPVEAIKYAMDRLGYTQADLARLIGSRSRASEILGRKRHLTVEMIWALSTTWGIPAEALIKPYKLKRTRSPAQRRPARVAAQRSARVSNRAARNIG
jgi:HTH-type transcriptional regulator/antitoxin HigA